MQGGHQLGVDFLSGFQGEVVKVAFVVVVEGPGGLVDDAEGPDDPSLGILDGVSCVEADEWFAEDEWVPFEPVVDERDDGRAGLKALLGVAGDALEPFLRRSVEEPGSGDRPYSLLFSLVLGEQEGSGGTQSSS